MNLARSHLPAFIDVTAAGMLRASAMMRDSVSSAALRVLPVEEEKREVGAKVWRACSAQKKRKKEGGAVCKQALALTVGHVHHQNAAPRRLLEVDIVDADSSAADDAQALGRGEDVLGHGGAAAHNQTLKVARLEHGDELGRLGRLRQRHQLVAARR